jgi:hypothetical protein
VSLGGKARKPRFWASLRGTYNTGPRVTLEHYNNASVRFSTSRLYRDIAVDTLLDGTLNHQIGILLGRANDEVTVEG